ncbi:MAG: arsenate reductase ArsC [bacterium]|nr:arsenate reductase ArsC [bacterium]
MMKKRVLVLCTGNSARSQLAEALINARRGEQWEAFSAGTEPAKQVNPYALRVLDELGINAHNSRPKSMMEFQGQAFDLVLTVCDDAAENCPFWPGQGRRVHVGFPDPAKAEGSDTEILNAFRSVAEGIETRILPLLDEDGR